MDAIQLGIRLDFTPEEFFASGGVTTFIDNMAGVLGIHKADLKIVAVYEGSTIVDFEVFTDLLEDDPLSLETVEATFIAAASTMDTFMDVPVLNVVAQTVFVETPNTPRNEDGEVDLGDFDNIWGGLEDDDTDGNGGNGARGKGGAGRKRESVTEDPNVDVEVKYKVKKVDKNSKDEK